MFGIGETELLIIVAFGFMIFGPDKLPGMGRTIGRALRQFRQAQEGFTEVVQAEVMDPLQEAMGDPLDTGTRKQRRATAEERAAALAQDADLDADAPSAAPAHKETFAERKARLAAERAEREAAAAAAAPAEAESDAAEDASASTSEDAAPAEPAAPAAPDTSAAALYAMGGRSKFAATKEAEAAEAAAKQAEAEAAAAAAAEPEPADETEPEAPAVPAVSTPATDGKEDESVQA